MNRMPSMLSFVPATEAAPPEKPKLFQDYLSIDDLYDAPLPDLDFVMPGLLRGTLGMLVSAGGTGKSMLALEWAISLAIGEDRWRALGADTKPRRVLFVNAEDPPEIFARRWRTLVNGDSKVRDLLRENLRIKHVTRTGWSFGSMSLRGQFVASTQLDILGEEVEEFRPDVTFIDTLNRASGGINENDNGAMGALITELECRLGSSAAVLLHHLNKSASLNGLGDKAEAVRGAGVLTANARFAQNLVGMDERQAKARGISEDRRFMFVRLPTPKANYVAPIAERWFKRQPNGVLLGPPRPDDIPDPDWLPPEWVKAEKGEKPTKAGDAAWAPVRRSRGRE